MRILVAQDDAPLADFLRQRLVQEQFAVQLASDGTEAQRMAANQTFDLVILDLNLPGAAGLDLLRGIRSRKPDLPVMVVTGSSMVEERVRGLDAGADDYVAKPFAFAELAARIRAVLGRGNRRQTPSLPSPILPSTASITPCSVAGTISSSAQGSLRCSSF
jgi:DNA-binding response OmpR family regulator